MAANLDQEDIGFQIAPMVDVVFVLLLFFMAAAGLRVNPLELQAALPSGNPVETSEAPVLPTPIHIAADGTVWMNGQAFDPLGDRELPLLSAQLDNMAATFGNRDPIVVYPHGNVQHQRVMDVLNALAGAEYTNVALR